MAWRTITWCEAPDAGYDHCPHEDENGNRDIDCEQCGFYATADEYYEPPEFDYQPYPRLSVYDL
ncbi:MAG: hypothetical protein J6Y35_01715 [Bacteroidales bacterium]|nr:hypothetical protein [Bacteroidales bacterium]